MSTPAGWYDDGSGRQRWWDGSQWTENYAPGAAVPVAGGAPAVGEPRRASTLGFIGLGLAVVGTVLACIPTVVTFGISVVVLLAAFVVSLIAVFRKNTVKWPSIVGVALSVIGGIVGAIVLVITLTVTVISQIPGSEPPTAPSASEQPSDPPATGDGAGRPSPEAIGAGYVVGLKDEEGIDEFKTPEVAACIGQALYDSAISDALLRHFAAGEVITEEIAGDEASAVQSVMLEASAKCAYGG